MRASRLTLMVGGFLWIVATMSPRDPAAASAAEAQAEDGKGSSAQVSDPVLADILKAWDRTQQETTSLVASFSERKELKLLAKPVLSRGEFYYQSPNRARWEYHEPDRKVFVITEDKYTAYYPALKRAEEVPIKKFVGKRLFRFLGVGQRIGDLARYYDFELAKKSDLAGTHLIFLTPRKKTVRDRVAEMKIWVDQTTFLPRQLQYVEADGDTTLLAFEGMRANVEVGEARFRVELPDDVAVSQTFNGFSLGQQSF
jgi:outer membrane lipoprotein-sorting protein